MQYDIQQPQGNYPKFGIMQMKRIALASLHGRWGEAMLPTFIYSLIMIVPSFISSILQMSSYRKLIETLETVPYDSSFNQNYLYNLQMMNQNAGSELFSSLVFIINIFLAGSLSIGFSILALKLLRREKISTGTIFEGFKNYGQAISLYILYTLLCIAISLILVIPFIVLVVGAVLTSTSVILTGLLLLIPATVAVIILILRLEMSFFIAADNRNVSASEALKRSAQIMKGNKGRYFLFTLSFIGWILLASMPAYIGMLLILFSGVLGASTYISIIGAILTVISIAAFCPLLLYIQTATAVFYSNVSGNFSTLTSDNGNDSFENSEISATVNQAEPVSSNSENSISVENKLEASTETPEDESKDSDNI